VSGDRFSSVAGDRLTCSLSAFEVRCEMTIRREQQKAQPDRSLLELLAEAVRLRRQYVDDVLTPKPEQIFEGPVPNQDVSVAQLLADAKLSPREMQVADYVWRGASPKDAATVLNVSVHTVRNHMKAIYRKLRINSRHELVALFWKVKGQTP